MAGGLEGRVAALEKRVAALLGQVGGGEELTANYLTVDAAGNVGANFSGVIAANGLFLPTAQGATQPSNEIQWHRTDGSQSGLLVSFDQAGTTELDLVANCTAAESAARIVAITEKAGAGTGSKLILDGAGNSGFPQLQGSARQQLIGQYAKACFTGAFGNALPDGAWTSIPMDTTIHDAGSHLVLRAGTNSGYQCPVAGDYLVTAAFQVIGNAANGVGDFSIFTGTNGNAPGTQSGLTSAQGEYLRAVPFADACDMTLTTILTCAASDIINVWLFYNAAGGGGGSVNGTPSTFINTLAVMQVG